MFSVMLLAASLSGAAADERVLASFAESTQAPHGHGNVYAPEIVKHGDRFLMFFGGQGKDGHDRIHLATSKDAITWKPHGVVFAPEGVNHVNDPSVAIVDGRFFMFHTRAAKGVTDTIGLATSADGKEWKDEGVIFEPSKAPAWDSLLVGRPSVMHDGKEFRMWYDGRKDLPHGAPDADAPKSPNSQRSVGYATSPDGKTWTRRSEPVFGEDSGGVHVSRVRERLVMVIESRGGTRWAVSRDGIEWTSRGILHARLAEYAGSWHGHVTPFLFADANGEFRLFYGGAASSTWDRNAIYSAAINVPKNLRPVQSNYNVASAGLRKATTDKERKLAVDRMSTFPSRFLELAEQTLNEDMGLKIMKQAVQAVGSADSAALNAWEMNQAEFPTRKADDSAGKIIGVLLRENHVASDKIGPICDRMRYGYRMEWAEFLRKVVASNPHPEMKAQASLALACFLRDRMRMVELADDRPAYAESLDAVFGKAYLENLRKLGTKELARKAEAQFERALEYSGGKEAIAEPAALGLRELRHLAVGKPAPEIERRDQDGVQFKLSDYGGKVVLLYFWVEF